MGRAAEIDRLRAALASAEHGTAGAVLVSGDAGVGKSRLFEELAILARQRGALVLACRCLDIGETGLPYLPFVEALIEVRRFDAALVAARPALARLLPGASLPAVTEQFPDGPPPGRPGVLVERDLGQLQLFDALVDLLTELAERQCVVLIVEDLHWADSSTRDLLSFLLSRLRGQRLLVLANYRSDDLHRRHPLRPLLAELVRLPVVDRIDLRPFDTAEARRFVTALSEGPLPPEVIEQIATRSEGNAFFAEELVAACADSGDGIPDALADLLLARVERLSPATQELVRLMSVGGRRVRHTRLQGVAQQEGIDLDHALREAVQHHVLLVDDRAEVYSFRHALLREAVYGDLLPGERVRLHAAYARYLAEHPGKRGVAAALAHHSLESHDLRTALAASFAASKEAERVGAPAEALRHVEQALQLWDAVRAEDRPAEVTCTEVELLRTASYLAAAAGQPERAVAFGRSAVHKLDPGVSPESAANTYRRLALALAGVDDTYQEQREAIEQAWQLVEDRPPTWTRAWVLAIRAQALRKDDPAKARQAVELAIADARAVGKEGPEADALVTLGLLDDHAGQADRALDHLTAPVRLAPTVDAISTELRARYFLGLHSHDRGDLAAAVREYDAGVARAKQTGTNWSSGGIELRVMQAIAKYTIGDWDGAEEAAEPPMRRVSDIIVARMAAAGAFVHVGRGRFEDARRVLDDVRPLWKRELELVLNGGYAGAELALWQGDPAGAVRLIDDAIAHVNRYTKPWLAGGIRLGAWGVAAHAELARRARRGRNPAAADEARAAADTLLDWVRTVGAKVQPWSGTMGPEGRGWLAVAEAERTRLDGAGDPDAWRVVVREFGYGHVYQQALGRLRLAEALLGADAREEAAGELARAAEVADRLAAKPLAGAIAELAQRGRLAVPGLVTRRDQVDPFTPRERAVLTLVAAGRTNRQVGEELYISEKTVSVHLSRIMTKLGASRRAEAVATAYERGLLEPES